MAIAGYDDDGHGHAYTIGTTITARHDDGYNGGHDDGWDGYYMA